MAKVLTEAQAPARFFKVLAEADLLAVTFAEIAGLTAAGFERTLAILDSVAKITAKPKLRFAALGLVLPPSSLAHWNERMTLPGDWLGAAVAVGNTISMLEDISPETVVTAVDSLRRGTLSVEEFDIVAKAGGLDLPELNQLKKTMAIELNSASPAGLRGKAIGQWLRQQQVEAIAKLL